MFVRNTCAAQTFEVALWVASADAFSSNLAIMSLIKPLTFRERVVVVRVDLLFLREHLRGVIFSDIHKSSFSVEVSLWHVLLVVLAQ